MQESFKFIKVYAENTRKNVLDYFRLKAQLIYLIY